MKFFTTALATIALTLSASTMAGSSEEAAPEQGAMDTMVKKLTMSCYRNREGDRMFVGAAETVRFCRSAARKTVASAYAQQGVELASLSQQSGNEGIN